LGELAIDNGAVFAHEGGAVQHRSLIELSRAGVELYADVRGDHGPKDGDVFCAVHANKNENKWIGFLARSDGPGKQEGRGGEESSTHLRMR
jgi:hypothetical protein